jgi:hypothetical protein
MVEEGFRPLRIRLVMRKILRQSVDPKKKVKNTSLSPRIPVKICLIANPITPSVVEAVTETLKISKVSGTSARLRKNSEESSKL